MYRFENVNDVFETYFGFKPVTHSSYNPVKIDSKDGKSIITIDVPGYKKEDVKISADEKILCISLDGIRGKKEYSFKLTDADILNITSKLEHGELEIIVPSKVKNKVNIEIK